MKQRYAKLSRLCVFCGFESRPHLGREKLRKNVVERLKKEKKYREYINR